MMEIEDLEDLDHAVDKAQAGADSIFRLINADPKFTTFMGVLRKVESNLGHIARVDARVADGIMFRSMPFVFPTVDKMDRVKGLFTDLLVHLGETMPDHWRHIEISTIALVVSRIHNHNLIAFFIVNLPLNADAVHGLVDRVKMLMTIDGAKIVLPESRAASPEGIDNALATLLESLHMMTTLLLHPDAIIAAWPAPRGYGFLGSMYEPGRRKVSFTIEECHNKFDVRGVGDLMTNPKNQKGCKFIEQMLQQPAPSTPAGIALELIRDIQARGDITAILTKGAEQVRLILDDLSPREWLVGVLSIRARRSKLTGEYEGDEEDKASEDEAVRAYAAHTISVKIEDVVCGLFNEDDTLNAVKLAELFGSSDPFMNEAFEPAMYQLSARWKVSWNIPQKKRAVHEPDLVKGPSLIKTHMAQLEKMDEGFAFDPTGLDYKTGAWLVPVDLRTCSMKDRNRHLTEYIRWIEKNRMKPDDMRFDMDAIVAARGMVIPAREEVEVYLSSDDLYD